MEETNERPVDHEATERAAELAEQLIEEISAHGHSWASIRQLADELASLASRYG